MNIWQVSDVKCVIYAGFTVDRPCQTIQPFEYIISDLSGLFYIAPFILNHQNNDFFFFTIINLKLVRKMYVLTLPCYIIMKKQP